nr:60S ribosomal protein L7 [Cryptomonas curvata]
MDFEKNLLEKMAIKKKLKKNFLYCKHTNSIRADTYVKEYKKKLQYNIDQVRISRSDKKFYVPLHAKTFFIIRIRGINDICPQSRKILELIRLNRINSGVFLKINSSTVRMIKKIEPYIAYGYPSLRSINMLIKKRGYGKVGKRGSWQRIFLSDNRIIQTTLSAFGIYTIEDIIQELFTGGSRFKEVNNFLWPFKLKSPKKGYSKSGKRKHISEGGVYGNWEESINQLILKMN